MEGVKFNSAGLVCAVVQSIDSGEVLMLAWMNRQALSKTIETGQAHFYSRSRKEQWHKGATSGNTLAVKEIFYDCDGDCVLLKVIAAGPACHTGSVSCFFNQIKLKHS